MSKNKIIVAILLMSSCAYAKDILPTAQERVEIVRRAEVWFQPSWIDGNLKFSDGFRVTPGPVFNDLQMKLQADTIDCDLVPDGISPTTGYTQKFVCNLVQYDTAGKKSLVLDTKNKPVELKVKYGPNSPEVFGEVLATRLFWALGFGADRMFFVLNTRCYGCSTDPFHNREIDPSSLETPRTFSPTAIERKLKGDNILRPVLHNGKPVVSEGWGYAEMNSTFSADPVVAHDQKIKREALTLLSIFVNHLDNRKVNQRLACLDELDAAGKCSGRAVLFIHDLGSTFGGGYSAEIKNLLKADYKGWLNSPIWPDAANCVGGVSHWGSQEMSTARISEEGRQFLLRLLKGFSEGPIGRDRVRGLFEAAHIELRGPETVEMWTDLFLKKVKDIEFPMGEDNPNFVCP